MIWKELERLDQDITLTMNSWNSEITDSIWIFFSDIPVWIPLYILIAGFAIWKLGWKKGCLAIAAALLTFTFCDQFSNFIKALTERLRPLHDPYMLNNGLHILEHGGKYGFFSAHAANAFGLATSTLIALKSDRIHRYRGYATFMYIWASLVALSRIFVGKHFLGDVIVGISVGLTAGIIFGYSARLLIKRIK